MQLKDYTLLQIQGKDAITLLNNLSTNLITEKEGIIYTCLLTPNGRFMYDFFLIQTPQKYIAINKNYKTGFIAYLNLYKLSAEITFQDSDEFLLWNKDSGTFQDPRHSNLGFYTLSKTQSNDISTQYHINRMKNYIADGFYDLNQKESIILEYGFDEINAISYTKGCYLGQELIARTHHTGIIRKRIYIFHSENHITKGTEIFQNNEKVGIVLGSLDGNYLAQIKFDNVNFTEDCIINTHKIKLYRFPT